MKWRNDNLTHHRRLSGHNYAEAGFYFVTFCTDNRYPYLADLECDSSTLTPIGQIVHLEIAEISTAYTGIEVDCYAIMPDHVHILLYISLANREATVSDVVRRVKGRIATRFRELSPESFGRLWQKGFQDQITRNDTHLENVRRYIAENPIRPGKDEVW